MLLVVVGEELGFVHRHIDRCRAFRLAALAGKAEVERIVQRVIGKAAGQSAVQRFEQHAGTAAGGVQLLARRHVGGAHGAGIGLAALADAYAAQRGPGKSTIGAEIEVSRDLQRVIIRPQLQMRVQRMRLDDAAGIHAPVGIEGALEFAEGRDQLARRTFWAAARSGRCRRRVRRRWSRRIRRPGRRVPPWSREKRRRLPGSSCRR